MTPKITFTDAPEDAAIQTLAGRIRHFNEIAGSRPSEHHPVAILISQPETGELLGGLFGWTCYAVLHIDLLYLPESLRGAGLGRRLVLQAEEEAERRGCHISWLDTYSFQAPGFYRRLGYSVFGTLEGYAPGHSRIFLKKELTRIAAPRPAKSAPPPPRDRA